MTSTQDNLRVWIAAASAVASSATTSLICPAPRPGRGVGGTAVAMAVPAAKPRAVRRLIEASLELSEFNQHLLVAMSSGEPAISLDAESKEKARKDHIFRALFTDITV